MVVMPVTEHEKLDPTKINAEPDKVRNQSVPHPRIKKEPATVPVDQKRKTMFGIPSRKGTIVDRHADKLVCTYHASNGTGISGHLKEIRKIKKAKR
jgi:hypothetical protein